MPDVKLKPRNLRCHGTATALFAGLSLSFNRRARKPATLAITRSPARRLRA
jgi:hypothetical protein